MKPKLYCLHFSGQGDNEFRIVNQEAIDWIFSPRPKFNKHGAAEETPPPSVIEARKLVYGPDYEAEEMGDVVVTVGSCENDRALACYYAEDGEALEYHSLTDYQKALVTKGIVIEHNYSFGIY